MIEYNCTNCGSDEYVDYNETNYAALYYCSNCNYSFNPIAWECPSCEDISTVVQSPFEDPWEYYCYKCDTAFNRLGPTIETSTIDSNTETVAAEYQTIPLCLTIDESDGSAQGEHKYTITLKNDGSEPIRTQGRQPIALQYQVSENNWWTIYGNPDRYTPTETVVLEPGQRLNWQITICPDGISGLDFSLSRDPLPSGTYRFSYWGTPFDDIAVGTCLSIDFKHGW